MGGGREGIESCVASVPVGGGGEGRPSGLSLSLYSDREILVGISIIAQFYK